MGITRFLILHPRTVKIGKKVHATENLVNQPWGAYLEIVDGKFAVLKHYSEFLELEQFEKDTDSVVVEEEGEEESETSTKKANDNVQMLSAEEIIQMKKKGTKAESIVRKLTDNSATFENKTGFAKEKYVNKKRKK
jgi:tRNA (adenine-N(1)-)-methyltransferase non-catalytic subunit